MKLEVFLARFSTVIVVLQNVVADFSDAVKIPFIVFCKWYQESHQQMIKKLFFSDDKSCMAEKFSFLPACLLFTHYLNKTNCLIWWTKFFFFFFKTHLSMVPPFEMLFIIISYFYFCNSTRKHFPHLLNYEGFFFFF